MTIAAIKITFNIDAKLTLRFICEKSIAFVSMPTRRATPITAAQTISLIIFPDIFFISGSFVILFKRFIFHS